MGQGSGRTWSVSGYLVFTVVSLKWASAAGCTLPADPSDDAGASCRSALPWSDPSLWSRSAWRILEIGRSVRSGNMFRHARLHDYIVQRHSRKSKKEKLQITTMVCWNHELWKKCTQNVQGNACVNVMKYSIYDMADIVVRRMSDHGDLSKHW